jgi:hypothetical protein
MMSASYLVSLPFLRHSLFSLLVCLMRLPGACQRRLSGVGFDLRL